jgi:hypothetical protein
MTNTETMIREDVGAAEAASYAKAILNILDDVGEERERQVDSQRAVLNILEDIDTEKIRLESTQKALLNILDDFDLERGRVDKANIDLREVNEAMRGFTARVDGGLFLAPHCELGDTHRGGPVEVCHHYRPSIPQVGRARQ